MSLERRPVRPKADQLCSLEFCRPCRVGPGNFKEGSPPALTSPNPLSTLLQRFACARLSRPLLDDDWERDLPKVRQIYADKRKPDDPPALEEFIEQKDPDHMARWKMNALPR